MKYTAILCFLLISGCASVADLQTSTPYATLSSVLPAQTVAQCIRDKWQSQRFGIEGNGAVLQQSGPNFTVVSPPTGFPSEVAKVSSNGQSTSISVFTQASVDLGGRKNKRVAAVKNCLE